MQVVFNLYILLFRLIYDKFFPLYDLKKYSHESDE